jgi:hypothetical protein
MKTTKLPKSAALMAAGFLALGLSGCGNNQMLEQRLGALDAEIKGMAAKQQQAEAAQAAAQDELARLKNLADQFEKASAEPTPKAASGLSGLPELKDRALLLKSLKHLSLEKEDEIKAMVQENSAEVESYGEPVLQMPDFFTHPYSAEVVVRIRKDGQSLEVPVPFRADWDGNWQLPDSRTVKDRVVAAARGEAVGPNVSSQPQAVATTANPPPGGNPAAPANAQTRPQPPPQPPPGPRMPNIPGVSNVREVDLTGKDIFKEP